MNRGEIKNMTIPTRVRNSSDCEVTPCKYKQGALDYSPGIVLQQVVL